MAQYDPAFVQKLLQDWGDQMWLQSAMNQDVLNQLTSLGAQPHGRHRPSRQALHGSSTGVPGSWGGGAPAQPVAGTGSDYHSEPIHPAIEEAGIRAGEIIAWRVWRLERREKIVPKTPLRPLPFVLRDRLAPAKYETEIVPDTPLLRSTYQRTIWEPGQIIQAHADPSTQSYTYEARQHSEFVGVFAWKTLGALCTYMQEQFGRLNRDQMLIRIASPELFVTGQVALWGSVIEHERGYRAQFAKPHRLFMVSDVEGGSLDETLRVELCRLYGLPEEGV